MTIPVFTSKRATAVLPYLAVVAVVLAGGALRVALDPLAGDFYPYTLYYALVPLIAWRYGWRAGLVAVGLSVVVVNYGLLEPRGALSFHAHALLGTTFFLWIGAGLVWLGDKTRRSREQLRAKTSDLEREVAERKHAEAEVERLNALLTQRLEELQAVIHASPIAIGVAGDAGCEHIWGNQVFADLLGVPAEINLSKSSPTADLPFKVYRQGVELTVAELPMQYCVRHGASVRNMEIEIKREDGGRRTVLANVAPLYQATGEIRGCVGIFVDITERKAVEREREEGNRRKDEFLATLAHELRNPLAPLRNAASILKQQSREDRKLQWVSDVIERQVRHMVFLVDDLLDLARVTRGLITLDMETVELRALVWQAIELVRPSIEQRKQRLRVDLPLDPVRLHVDRMRMTQVIANILGNAVKYTPEGGWILFAAKEDRSVVNLTIRDSGAGIAADLLPRVFDMFVRGNRALVRTEGGLGIGLTLVKKIVELHAGAVEANSAGTGKGAEFIVTLPLWRGPHTSKAPTSPKPAFVPHKILVVDDNTDVADTLALLLRTMGHEVRTAYRAEEALAVARDFGPVVALLDIGLPDMDGYALAARFRADALLRQVRLVALSGYADEDDRARSAAAGFVQHVAKPYRLDRLEALLAEIAPSGGAVSPPGIHERTRSVGELAADGKGARRG